MQLPVSLIFITADRTTVFEKTLQSLFKQNFLPKEVIVIDASLDEKTAIMLQHFNWRDTTLQYEAAIVKGAAEQRNQGIKKANYEIIGFFDDDILLEANCFNALYSAISSNPGIGGVNAFITNQHSVSPGKISKFIYWLMRDKPMTSYDGKCFGPAVNTLTLDYKGTKNLVEVDWLNSTCTLYKKEALPDPVFDKHFSGYALMEDLTLSLRVGQKWQLRNVQDAKIFHDSQPGVHKNNQKEISRMELVNRHYVMTQVLQKRGISDYCKLFLWELFNIVTGFISSTSKKVYAGIVLGKLMGIRDIIITSGKTV